MVKKSGNMRITIILVAPARAENIGAAARAMKTMGFSELRIVDSQAHLEPATRWVAHGSGDIIDNIKVFPTLVESLHDVDFTVATTARSRAKYHYYATPVELVPLLEEKSSWMSHAALVFGREDSGLTNEELALADVLTGVPMVADYPSLNLGQAVMVYCYQLATLIQQPTKSDTTADQHQLQALRERVMALLTTLAVADDIKLVDWLQQRLGLLEQRDTAMLHRLLHDIEKISPNKKRLSKYFSAFHSDCNGQYVSVWIKKRVSDSSF
ncbi:RNA methyltransferase, TrmH family, group 1 [Escherichia coli 3.2303]|nr:RNA methyltransferase, TrmH family, group 1 [Escherichia coli 3.2303]